MKIYLSTLLFMAIAACLLSCSETAKKAEVIKPVKYEEVAFKGGIEKRSFTGVSQSGSETNLSFRISGLILKLDVNIGDRVRKGKLLAELDKKDIQLSYQQEKASVQSARIQMETSKSNLQRTKELYQSESSSLDDYEDAKSAFANAKSSYETAVKSLDLIGSQFEYAKIVAPITGVVSAVNSEVNEYVQAGSTIVIMDAEDANIEINVGVPELYISKIKNGDAVDVEINDQTMTGTVTEVGFSASGAAVFPVIIQLNSVNSELRPGMPSAATFTFGSKDTEQYLVVPIYAVGEDDKGNFVFVIESAEDSTTVVRKQHIQIGDLTDEGFRLLEGLDQGQKIATAGLQTLLDGQKVKL
ncbi:MAG: efflux RND transporter periplasmic adaptor subunit [Bacteroidota bacterium]